MCLAGVFVLDDWLDCLSVCFLSDENFVIMCILVRYGLLLNVVELIC